jgi:hypothetical protein
MHNVAGMLALLALACGRVDIPSPKACANPIDDAWTYPMSERSQPWSRLFGDPIIDAEEQVLDVSFDDIAARTPLPGSYWLSFDLDFDEDLTFFLTFHENTMLVPSITRTGGDIFLAGARYGRAIPVALGGFRGHTLAAQKIRVFVYVKAGARELAMRVLSPGGSFDSGFVPADGQLDRLLIVGGNVPGTPSNRLGGHVGRLTGCAALADDELDALLAE